MEIPVMRDEPVTPAGRLFLQPEMNQVIHALIGVKYPWDVEAVKSEIGNSLMVKHPRFSSLMVRDSCGREKWRRTRVNVDDHFVIRREPLNDTVSDEDAVNEYLADLAVSSPLPADKPLWEIHLLLAHNCAVLRIHHSLGDGISIVSLFMSCCRKIGDPTQTPAIGGGAPTRPRRRWSFKRLMMVLWYTLVYVLEFALRSLWLKDKPTAVSGGDGVELWPRKLATAKFTIDDMKTVKKAVADATINDVLFGVIACGLSRYLDMRSSKGLRDGLQITGVAMVNLRPQPGLQDVIKLMNSKSGTRWGNKIGILLLPVNYYRNAGSGSDPLKFVKRAKAMIDKKKLSLEALCSYKVGYLVMSLLGAKVASILNYRVVCNSTFTISNVVGPQEEISFAGHPITYIRANSSSLPHAITMHMLSYAGKAELQILVAKDIIPDPKVLAKCFEDSLMEMKAAAEQSIPKT
ncbi:O-acyltransferase WSD1-like [Ipomoea triloba]|uniref:O-acyltransferase WSD1-like n=1 Tax=Ipomoea triloba TaxID=35885 RepID=UPI00125D05B1|nr:O-acyltransferase WSD1-like [Ipomoea triloba]